MNSENINKITRLFFTYIFSYIILHNQSYAIAFNFIKITTFITLISNYYYLFFSSE
jgi:hypothetical protein